MGSKVSRLHAQAGVLFAEFQQTGRTGYIDETIVLDREALEICPPGHGERAVALRSLGVHLYVRYKQLGATRDLDEAITLDREVLNLRPKGHPDRFISLNDLAVHLSAQYHQLGAIQDIEEVIVLAREALDLLPKWHPDRFIYLDNLASHLSTRYPFEVIQDLNEVISLRREVLSLLPKGHPDHLASLNALVDALRTRYTLLEFIQDLEEVIVFDREVHDLLLKGHSDRSHSLGDLAGDLSTRYNRLGVIQDLEEALVLDRELLSLWPKGHPNHSFPLVNLAVDLSTRYNQLGVIQDLDEAIALGREEPNLLPEGHPNCSWALNHISDNLSARYDHLEVIQDLEEAIILGREALALLPKGHPKRSTSLDNLARSLRTRINRLGQLQDKEELFGLCAQLTHVDQCVSSIDIAAAGTWTRAAEDFRHPSLLLGYETSLRLLIRQLVTTPSLRQYHATLKQLTSTVVDAFSACLHYHAPARAVELLEQGRGVFWSQLTRLHSPLHDVFQSGPAGETLLYQFTRLSLAINHALNGRRPDGHELLCHLNLKMQQVVAEIQRQPGLSRFLLPPLFSDLQRAAVAGPVIVLNASEYSCDALIVLLDCDPVHIPLQITREILRNMSAELHTLSMHGKTEDMTNELGCFLRDVWDRIVCPIIDVLQMILPSVSRIWWCPTADFCLLPLHAAGPYRKGQRNLADLYVSSYTPTLSALIRSRRQDRSPSDCAETHFVAIGQANAQGESELISVGTELDNIGRHIKGLATFTRMDEVESCVHRVVEELRRNEWVHLACHGIPNPAQPFESAFALRDGYFTIQQIIGCELKNAEFAYLSACHTTVGDKESPDEVIHPASVMQFIGFRSVIGTMWAVDDSETHKIAPTFYKHMVDDSGRLDYTRAALALNRTMRSVNVPFDQRILYVHLGA